MAEDQNTDPVSLRAAPKLEGNGLKVRLILGFAAAMIITVAIITTVAMTG